MRPFFLGLCVLSLSFSGCKPPGTKPADRTSAPDPTTDKVVKVSKDDAAMQAAIEQARASVGDFVQALHAAKPGTRDFAVKKPYPTPNGGHEHMWIAVTGEKDGTLQGSVDNDAVETRAVKNGDAVTLTLPEISDWKYQDGRKLVGGYTIRYFIDRMSPEERKAFLDQTGFEL